MKILMMVYTYYPYTDGLQGVTQYQAEGLTARGHEVTVITTVHPSAPMEETYNGVHILRLNYANRHGIYRGNRKEYIKLVLELSKEMDVVIPIGMQAAQTDWILPYADKLSCKKVLYLHGMADFKWHRHNLVSISSIASKLWNNLRWKTLYFTNIKNMQKFDAIFQLHRFDPACTFCERHHMSRSYVIENSANEAFFEDNLLRPESLPNPYVICVANYLRGKNQKICLEAFYQTSVKNCELVFIGSHETDYLEQLKKWNIELAAKYGERKVHFFVGIPRKEIAGYVKYAEIYLFGSVVEKYPLSIAESMATGVPFITTDVGCVRFLPGGIVIRNVTEMAYFLDMLLKNPQMAEAYGVAGREYAKQHMREAVNIDILEKNLMEVIANE